MSEQKLFTYVDLCNAVHAHQRRASEIFGSRRIHVPDTTLAERFTASVAQLRRDLEAMGLDVSFLDWDSE